MAFFAGIVWVAAGSATTIAEPDSDDENENGEEDDSAAVYGVGSRRGFHGGDEGGMAQIRRVPADYRCVRRSCCCFLEL
eukprot:COSAG06_NODE_4386_length_4311_cov_41.952991_4_plen_79_part_00